MAKKYDVNDLVNVIPTLLNDPLGSLAVFLENNQETNKEQQPENIEDPEMESILKAEEEIRKKKEELLKKKRSLKERLRSAVKQLENGSNNYNDVYLLIDEIKN